MAHTMRYATARRFDVTTSCDRQFSNLFIRTLHTWHWVAEMQTTTLRFVVATRLSSKTHSLRWNLPNGLKNVNVLFFKVDHTLTRMEGYATGKIY